MLQPTLKLLANLNYSQQAKLIYSFSQTRRQNEHILIIGAGVIGVTTAIPFLENGYKVTLIDKEAFAATQTSHLNGCVFTPYHHKPLVSMANMLQFFKSWFQPSSAYHLNLNIIFEKNFWVWIFNAFILSMTKNCNKYNSQRILDIGEQSHQEFQRLRTKYPNLFSHQKIFGKGQIGLYKDKESMMQYKSVLDSKMIPNEIITDIKQFEKYHPDLLNSLNQDILSEHQGCLVIPSETSLETSLFTKNAVEFLKQEFHNTFQVKFNCESKNLIFSGDKLVTGVSTTQGDFFASKIIFATATSQCSHFNLNTRIPILPVRGWTTGIPYQELDFKNIGIPLPFYFNIFNSNMFCAPIDGQLRLSGIAHLIKKNGKVDHWGSVQLLKQFNEMYKLDIKNDNCQFSQCYRPISPDDGAIVSRIEKFENIYVNNGHGSKGTSHGFGAAKILYEIIDQGAEKKWEKFKLDRFYFT